MDQMNQADKCVAQAENPKLSLAATLLLAAADIERLQDQATEYQEKLELVYLCLDDHQRGKDPAPFSRTSTHHLRALAEKYKREADLELEASSAKALHFPGPIDGRGGLHLIVSKFQAMAFEVEHAASQYLKAPEQTRPEFLKVFFQRLRSLTTEAVGYGLDKPLPPV